MRRAFTLVELLIVIAIIALLAAMMMTALRHSRESAHHAIDLSQLRQTYLDFRDWANAHNDVIVNAGTPHEDTRRSREYYGGLWGSERGWNMYLAQNELWPKVLARWNNGAIARHWHSSYEEFESDEIPVPSANEEDIFGDLDAGPDQHLVLPTAMHNYQTEYRLGRTLLTSAHIWMNPGHVSKKQWARSAARSVRFHDITHPSRKGLLCHSAWPGAEESGRAHILFADGSASLRSLEDAKPTAVPPFRSSGMPGMPVDATFNGYLGIDF